MISLLLILLFAFIAFGIGNLSLKVLFRSLSESPLNKIERIGHALALGLGIGSLGTFFLGICGFYAPFPIGFWWSILGVAGLANAIISRGSNPLPLIEGGSDESNPTHNPFQLQTDVESVQAGVASDAPTRSAGFPLHKGRETKSPLNTQHSTLNTRHFLPLLCGFALIFFGIVSLVNCFVAPGGLQWDAISYHLADQKLFIQLGRIVSLPTEHHSNFPLIADTLFGVGLLFSDFVLANLFSLLFGVATVCVLYGYCARTLSHEKGLIAATLFVTTPVVLWEFSVAYIDLAVSLYTCAGIFALLSARRKQDSVVSTPARNGEWNRGFLLLAALEMGFALGCKYLALVPFLLAAIWLFFASRRLRETITFAGVALLLASPWLVRNLVTVHNPVYPFAYSLFPSSKYWSADRAAAYQGEQDSFGETHKLSQPLQSLSNLLRAPLKLLTHPDRYSNPGEFSFFATAGIVFGIGILSLLLPGLPSTVRLPVLFGIAQLAGWFFAAQVMRYVITFAPLFCVGAAELIGRAIETAKRSTSENQREGVEEGKVQRGVRAENTTSSSLNKGLVVSLLAGQVGLALWGVARLPNKIQEAVGGGVGWSSLSLFTIKDALTDGNEAHLRRTLDNYAAIEWLNTNTPKDAKVLFYDDVRGFYLDRFFVWADYNHSSWIDYKLLSNGNSLTKWLRKERFGYALINLNQVWSSRFANDTPPRNREYEAFNSWYVNHPDLSANSQDWRKPIYEAAKSGLWKPVYAKNGVLILQIGDTL